MPIFIFGAGFNVDAVRELEPGMGHPVNCAYPLVRETLRLCFDRAEIPAGKSIEDLFSDALERKDHSPLSRLADRLRQADYYIAYRVAYGEKLNCYQEFFQTFAGNNFLTFNYDSLPETLLFRLRLWYPHDGYGVPVVAHSPPGADQFVDKRSTSLVLHLHGSLCIRTSEFEAKRKPGEAIAWLTEREQPRYEFDPSSNSANFAPFHREVGDDDVSDRIIAPVPDKSHGLRQVFVRDIYTKARALVRSSDTLVAIGYSFNAHDRASYLPLLHSLNESRDRRLLIVSPDAGTVADRIRLAFPNLSVEQLEATFKQWVAASFPGEYLQR